MELSHVPLIIQLGVLPDVLHNNNDYRDAEEIWLPHTNAVYSDWQFKRNIYDRQTYSIQLKDMESLTDDMTLLLSVGVEMGMQVTDTLVEEAKRAGCAKVLKVG